MGVTVDLIPRLPGEEPSRAIARIYEGGVAIRWDRETESMTLESIHDGEPIVEAPPAAFDGLHTIFHWPDVHGTWCDLDDPDDWPVVIG